jgi:hypothetical protein
VRKRKPAGPSVAEWNALYRPGVRVRYWSGIREGEGRTSRTRSEAWDLCGSPVVAVEGHAGGIALTHVQPLAEDLP